MRWYLADARWIPTEHALYLHRYAHSIFIIAQLYALSDLNWVEAVLAVVNLSVGTLQYL